MRRRHLIAAGSACVLGVSASRAQPRKVRIGFLGGAAKDAIGLVTRRLPQPLPGTGAIAEYAEMGNFGVRVLMSYAPNTLAQQFTVDVLYGCAVLRNSHAVQVLS